jgi:hypothetical protein
MDDVFLHAASLFEGDALVRESNFAGEELK